MNMKTKKMTTVAMMCAIAYVVMIVGRIPIVLFLKYDPKDVIITICGFIFGPLTAFLASVIVSSVEMVTASETGIIGLIMNILSTCAFACTAAYIYKRVHTLKGAVVGLVAGCALMTAVMLLWNYLVTPLYMGRPREEVVALLLPAFLPFNLLKGGINAALTMLIYKPVVTALRRADLIPKSESSAREHKIGVMLVSGLLIVTCALVVLICFGHI